MVQAMNANLKSSQLARLSRIEGQVRGISRMVDEDRYCIDILTQIRAVKAALNRVEQEILRDHLKHCVSDAFHGGSEKARQSKIDELIELLGSRPA
jgi:CsoR family transcriptional regulator, copper-sensing transcriptional repressor